MATKAPVEATTRCKSNVPVPMMVARDPMQSAGYYQSTLSWLTGDGDHGDAMAVALFLAAPFGDPTVTR